MPEHLWSCTCGGPHFLRLRTFGQDAALEGYFTVEGDFRTSWFRRLIMAWRILCNGHEDSWIEVYLTPEIAQDIAGKLTEYAKEQG